MNRIPRVLTDRMGRASCAHLREIVGQQTGSHFCECDDYPSAQRCQRAREIEAQQAQNTYVPKIPDVCFVLMNSTTQTPNPNARLADLSTMRAASPFQRLSPLCGLSGFCKGWLRLGFGVWSSTTFRLLSQPVDLGLQIVSLPRRFCRSLFSS